MTSQRSVLLASHSPSLTTGYARVCRELASELCRRHDLTILAAGRSDEPHSSPYRIITSAVGADRLDDALAGHLIGSESLPDLLITIGDPWMFRRLPGVLAGLGQRRSRWLAYFPIDAEPLPREWVKWILACDLPVVFSRFAQTLVEQATGKRPVLLPHGVDTAVFSPADRAAAKQRVGVQGRFVVGTVAANQLRKNLPALVKAFAIFAADKADAVLYFHTPIQGYWDIEELVERFGIADKTRATMQLDPLRGVPDEVLATVYNSFDVFALPTMAEGFGLPILEGQSCGVPALATDYSACPDLLPDPWQRLCVREKLILARNFDQALIDEGELTSKLNRLYHDPALREKLGRTGRDFALSLDWKAITPRFVDLAGKCLDG